MTQPAIATVLTVEDDPVVRVGLRLVLEDAGFSVCPDACDGVEAVELAREHNPDVILLDLDLPQRDGVETTRRILDERDVPIVALTGHARRDLVEHAVEAGAAGYVLKPFSERELVDALHDAIVGPRDVVAPVPLEPSRRTVDAIRRALGYPDAWAAEFGDRALAWGTWRAIEEEGRAPDDRHDH